MNVKPVIWGLLAVGVLCSLPSATMACGGPYFSHYALWPPVYVSQYPYLLQAPPYFATYPPVYYRVGGSGPYASSRVTETRPVKRSAPLLIRNRFVVEEADTRPSSRRDGVVPERIVNPFVDPL